MMNKKSWLLAGGTIFVGGALVWYAWRRGWLPSFAASSTSSNDSQSIGSGDFIYGGAGGGSVNPIAYNYQPQIQPDTSISLPSSSNSTATLPPNATPSSTCVACDSISAAASAILPAANSAPASTGNYIYDTALQLYHSIGRDDPDPGGVQYWGKQIAAGDPGIAQHFYDSALTFKNSTNPALVDTSQKAAQLVVDNLYASIGAPESAKAAGNQYWADELASGKSIDQVHTDFLNAAAGTSNSSDSTIVASAKRAWLALQ